MQNRKGLQIILDFVVKHTDIPEHYIRGKERHGSIVKARHLYLWLARHYTTYTLSEIGSFVSRDHATCLHACKKFNDIKEVDKKFDLWLATILESFMQECMPELKKIRVLTPYEKARRKMERKYLKDNADRLFYENKIAEIYNIAAAALQANINSIQDDAVMEGFRKTELLKRNKEAKYKMLQAKML